MNDKLTVSTFELFKMFPDAESARVYLEARLWPEGAKCPVCGLGNRITIRKGGYYRCNQCKEDFTVRTGTIFERSHVPLHKWIYAMYLMVTSRKGISSMQLSKEIGITQKSAWFVLQRLREACDGNPDMLEGIIEVDETYIGGKEDNKHANKKIASYGGYGKSIVIGMRQRNNGRTIAKRIPAANSHNLQNEIMNNVKEGSTLHTDEHRGYIGIGKKSFTHETINHSEGQYAHGNITTNGIESVWALLKRGLHGVYHHASAKHLNRYVNEFTFRLNEGNVKIHTMDRLNSLIKSTTGNRITYKELIK